MKKRLGVMFLVLAYFLLIGSTYFFVKPVNNGHNNVCPDITQFEPNKKGIHYYLFDGEYTLSSYHINDNGCKELNEYKFTIETDNKNAQVISMSKNKRYVLYKDNAVKLYDTTLEKTKKIDLDVTDENLYFVESDDEEYDVSGVGSSKGFYSISLDKVIYKDIIPYGYTNEILDLVSVSKYYYETENLISIYSQDDIDYLLKTDEERVIHSIEGPCSYKIYDDNNFIVVTADCCLDCLGYYFFDKMYNKILDGRFSSYQNKIYEGYLYIIKDNSLYKYDEKGNYEILGTYEELFQIFNDNSILYLKDGYLHYENKNYNISKNIVKWESKYYYQWCASYIDDNNAYIVVEYKDLEKKDDEGYTLIFNLDLKTQKIKTEKREGTQLGACAS